jgi:hypothetical protein
MCPSRRQLKQAPFSIFGEIRRGEDLANCSFRCSDLRRRHNDFLDGRAGTHVSLPWTRRPWTSWPVSALPASPPTGPIGAEEEEEADESPSPETTGLAEDTDWGLAGDRGAEAPAGGEG